MLTYETGFIRLSLEVEIYFPLFEVIQTFKPDEFASSVNFKLVGGRIVFEYFLKS